MNVTVDNQRGVPCVRVEGELLGDDGNPFIETLDQLLDTPNAKVVVDLSGVTFVNSSGLGQLVSLTARANAHHARLVLAKPAPFVAGVFETTQLDRFFSVYADVDQALAALAE